MRLSPNSLLKRAREIRLLAMDVDGVLTGGEVVVLESGEEIKFWNAKDRLGLALACEKIPSLKIAWITGRSSSAVARAGKDLGIHFVVQHCSDKRIALQKIIRAQKISLRQAAFIGDDLIDLPVLKDVGFSACPADAVADVKKRVNYVSPFPGGKGMVRDILELILKAQNKWHSVVRSFYL